MTPSRLIFPRGLFLIFFLLFCTQVKAQLGPLVPKTSTRAVVVGISSYQNISKLRFAHRDAEAFAQFLISPAGGKLPEENIKLLTNEKATMGGFGAALWWLISESQTGDQ